MAQVEYTGAEFLGVLQADIVNDELPFPSYLTFGALSEESWSSQSFDDKAPRLSLGWKSTKGSLISVNSKSSGDENNGTSKATIKVTSKNSGILITSSWNNSWSPTTDNKSTIIDWSNTGESPGKDDDFSYKWAYSQKFFRNDAFPGSTVQSLDFSNKDYVFKWEEYANGKSDNWKTTIPKYSYKDLQANQSFSLSGSLSANVKSSEFKIAATNIKYSSDTYTVSTISYSSVLSKETWDALPKLTSSAESLQEIGVGIAAWLEIFSTANNKINITSAEGLAINAQAGNDTIIGGMSDDTIEGSTGVDQLTGGGGGDVFVFNADDSTLSAKKSDQVKDFKVTENDQIKLEGLAEIKCHVRDVKESSFASAQADANKDFSEGLNVSAQFVGNNALVFVDFDGDIKADSVITLVGLKAGNGVLVDYAESTDMFA